MSAGDLEARGGDPVPGLFGSQGRLLVAGDTHGNLSWIRTLAKLAARHGCDGIVQLGDFGFWPDLHELRSHRRAVINDGWLSAVAGTLTHRGLWMRIVDGNHDWIDGLAVYDSLPSGVVPVRNRLLDWAGRGTRWEWCGVRFGALGGAHSTDQDARVPGVDWWPTELVTDRDVARLSTGPLDVLLTMTPPTRRSLAGTSRTASDPTSSPGRTGGRSTLHVGTPAPGCYSTATTTPPTSTRLTRPGWLGSVPTSTVTGEPGAFSNSHHSSTGRGPRWFGRQPVLPLSPSARSVQAGTTTKTARPGPLALVRQTLVRLPLPTRRARSRTHTGRSHRQVPATRDSST